MLKEYFVIVNELAKVKQASMAAELIAYKQADASAPVSEFLNRKFVANQLDESGNPLSAEALHKMLKSQGYKDIEPVPGLGPAFKVTDKNGKTYVVNGLEEENFFGIQPLHKEAFKRAADQVPAAAPSMQDKAMAAGKDMLAMGQNYAPSVGYGAGAGALAGVPLALLANAIFGKDKSLRGHLRSALMGAILGGGAGAVGGGALKYLHGSSPEMAGKIDAGVDKFTGLLGKGLGKYDAYQGAEGPSSYSHSLGNKIKNVLG